METRYSAGLAVLITLALLIATFSFQFHSTQGVAANRPIGNSSLESFPKVNDPKLKVEEVFEGLRFPTSMAFLDSADVLITEKNNGTIQRITNWNIRSPILDVNVATRHSRGMLGISVSNESTHKYVFVYFTRSSQHNDSNGQKGEESGGNVIYRYELTGFKLLNPFLLLKLPPEKQPDHNGGALTIGPDKKIYILIGDGGNDTTEAQNIIGGGTPNGSGGILTMTPQGSSGKKIIGDTGIVRKYYAYGIRNGYGLDFDPISGKLWDTENGPSFGDEINLVEPGFNSGWSKMQGKWNIVNNSSGEPTKGETATEGVSNLVDFGGKGKYSAPKFTWNNTVGPTALIFSQNGQVRQRIQERYARIGY